MEEGGSGLTEKSRRPACTLHSQTRPVPPQALGPRASSQEWLCPHCETAALNMPTEPPHGGQGWSQGRRVRGQQRAAPKEAP